MWQPIAWRVPPIFRITRGALSTCERQKTNFLSPITPITSSPRIVDFEGRQTFCYSNADLRKGEEADELRLSCKLR